jgi:subtilase family serine protease
MLFVFMFSSLAFSQPDHTPINVNLQVPGSHISPGESFPVSCKVRNIGTANSVNSSSVGFYLSQDTTWDPSDLRLDGDVVGNVPCCQMNSSVNSSLKFATLTIPANTLPGQWHILFVADEYDNVAESDETNNVKYKEVDVITHPDLRPVNAIASTSGPVSDGSSVSASCKIQNLGSTDATMSTVGFYFSANPTLDGSEVLLGSAPLAILAGNTTSGTMSATFTIPPGTIIIPPGTTTGTYYILFVADKDNVADESDETNNVESWSIAVNGSGLQADLLPISMVLASTTVNAGSTVAASCKIRNKDLGYAGSISRVGFYLSVDQTLDGGDELLGHWRVENLAGKTSSYPKTPDLAIPFITPSGSYYILWVADMDDDVAESDETNNVRSTAITINNIGIQPDLIPIAIVSNAGPVNSGSSFIISFKNRNIGVGAAPKPTYAGFYLSDNTTLELGSDTELGSVLVGTLKSGTNSGSKSANVTIPGTTPTGTYYILYVADMYDDVAESDETNNVKYRQIDVDNVPQLANLRPVNVNLTLNAVSVSAGDILPVDSKVKNLGYVSSGTTSLGYYLSDNTTYEIGDVRLGGAVVAPVTTNCMHTESAQLPASLTIPLGTPDGTWYILYFADEYDDEVELDETDNVKYKQFLVQTVPSVMSKTAMEPGLDQSFGLKQFPNPTRGQLFVEFTAIANSNETVELSIFDFNGRLVFARELKDVAKGVKYELDLSKLASGFYNVIYTSKDEVVSEKLIITKN